MITSHSAEQIVHRPYGDRHPYQQSPVERFPRDPVADRPTTLGVATGERVEAVWAEWWVEGGGKGQAAGQQGDVDGAWRTWRVPLPPFAHGRRVGYRLHARRGEETFHSRAFAFTVAAWRAVARVTGYHFGRDQMQLALAVEETAMHARLTLSFRDPGLVQLQWTAARQAWQVPPHVATGSLYTVTEERGSHLAVATAALRIVVERQPYRLSISTADGASLLEESQPPAWLLDDGDRPLQLEQTFVSPRGEAFYGFGERFNALNQRGQQLDVRVHEEYKNQGTRTYIPVPFFVSSRGYGLYLDTSRYVAYDLGGDGAQWSYRAEVGDAGGVEGASAAALSCYLIVRQEPWHIVAAFTDLTGKPALPPAWAFGPWMSSNDWNSQALVREQVWQTQAHEIPATVLVIEAWSDEATFYIWNDARYQPRPGNQAFRYDDFTFPPDGLWPDPRGMIDDLHRQGMRLLLWQIPVMKQLQEPPTQHANDQAYMLAQGYCVRQADGEPYRIRPFWFHDGLLWDVTDAAGVEWWLQKRAYLLQEMGVDGFKTDGGEHIWGRDLRFSDGRGADELWNLYPNLYVGAYYQFANKHRNGDAITFSRAGFTGAQAYPCHWAGDENSTWAAFRASIVAGLSAGISGIPFWGWDLAGFSGEIPTAELYLRATAMATFCPIMQYHSEYNARRTPSRDRTPWNIQARTGDEVVIPVFRHFANLRMNLLPYITSEAWHAGQTGVPLMRALPLAFPDDAAARDYPYQYLFGPALLVAPVVAPDRETWSVYLPPGTWYDFWTGARYEGAQVVDVPVPKERIPVFARAGAVLPLNLDASRAVPSAVGNRVERYRHLCFRLYPDDGVSYSWYDHLSGESYGIHGRTLSETGLSIEVPAIPYPVTLMVPALSVAGVALDGEALRHSESVEAWQQASEDGWYKNAGRGEVWVRLAPSPEARTLRLASLSVV